MTALVTKFLFSEASGRLLENMVFLELRRRGQEMFYHQKLRECDFVIRQGTRIVQAIQVCERTEAPKTLEREIEGLTEAMNTYGLSQGTLILRDGPERLIDAAEGKTIRQIPAWQCLLAAWCCRQFSVGS